MKDNPGQRILRETNCRKPIVRYLGIFFLLFSFIYFLRPGLFLKAVYCPAKTLANGASFLGFFPGNPEKIKLGIDVLVENKRDLIKDKKVGLITNYTGVDSSLRMTKDILHSLEGVDLTAIYAPEHGFKGGVQGDIDNEFDQKTGVPVYSLYGQSRIISPETLKGIDVLLFDIQDIGSRAYTYISTLELAMEAAARNKIKFIVLDRPNPINGIIVDGPVLDPKFKSFIGIAPIACIHGMTVGELAVFFNEELGINCDLEVVKMRGWKRNMSWRNTNLTWVPTSPHIPEMDTPWYYSVTGIIGELPFVNIGVGYTLPFKLVGAPWIDAEEFSRELNSRGIPGVYFQPFYFKPNYFLYKGSFCGGVRIIITDEKTVKPVLTGYYILEVLMKMYPDKVNFKQSKLENHLKIFDNANGTDKIRLMLENSEPAEKIEKSYSQGLKDFMEKRKKYLLYD